jgi:cytosine/adenosine deaminase-related metal-dependent hydrolase
MNRLAPRPVFRGDRRIVILRRLAGIEKTCLPTSSAAIRCSPNRPIARTWQQIDDGAVLQRDGVIAEIGAFAELSARHPDMPVIGTGRQVVLPGFVNGHHHIGLTPLQLGSPDMPLELWFVTRLVTRRVDLYLDTLYAAFEMIASGITTVEHLHGWLPGDLSAVEAGADEVIRAYQDIGMRVSYSFALRDQNRLVYQDDKQFTQSLPVELEGDVRGPLKTRRLTPISPTRFDGATPPRAPPVSLQQFALCGGALLASRSTPNKGGGGWLTK